MVKNARGFVAPTRSLGSLPKVVFPEALTVKPASTTTGEPYPSPSIASASIVLLKVILLPVRVVSVPNSTASL